MVQVTVVSHPLASTTVTVQSPAQSPKAPLLPSPLGGTGDQLKLKARYRPCGVTTMLPSQPPQEAFLDHGIEVRVSVR